MYVHMYDQDLIIYTQFYTHFCSFDYLDFLLSECLTTTIKSYYKLKFLL